MIIRPATIAEVSELVRLVNSAYRGEEGQVGWTNEAHLIGGPRTSAVDVEELVREPGGVILTGWGEGGSFGKGSGQAEAAGLGEAGSAAGLGELGHLLGCVYLKLEGQKLYLGMLSVWPELQGAGIGKRLMEAAAEYAAEHHCTAIRITVISVRDELIAWYERHGFRRTGEVEAFHAGDRFGTLKRKLELAVLEKLLGI